MRTSDPTKVRRGWGSLALLALALSSCSRETRPAVYPVQGTVTFQKRPATKAVVVLRPLGPNSLGSTLPHGTVDADGRVKIGTYDTADGAPAGEYAVTITWPETKSDPGGGEITTGDRLSGRYNDPAKSKWKVQVRDGSNDLEPFRLD